MGSRPERHSGIGLSQVAYSLQEGCQRLSSQATRTTARRLHPTCREILKHENIDLEIGRRFSRDTEGFSHLFYSGQLDEYFDYAYGRLPYRTLRFEHEVRHGTFQNCGTVNYCDEDIPYTRIVEHKHFWPWESFPDATVVTYEYSHECSGNDRPYYPIHLPGDNSPTREIHRARQTGEADELGRPARNISIHRYGQGNRGSHGCAGNDYFLH